MRHPHRRPAGLAAAALLAAALLAPGALAQQPTYGKPTQPTYGQAGQAGQPTYGQPTYGAAGNGRAGQPGYTQPTAGSATEQDLRRSEQMDSGRGLEWFYIGAEGGVTWLGADALSKSGGPLLTGGKKAGGVGPGGGLFVGGRALLLTAGARLRTAWLPDSQFLTVGGEVGLHIPKGKLEPHLWLGGGYATLLGVSEKVGGFDVVLGGGLDYYLSNYFTVGGVVSAELVSLSRGAYQGSPKASTLGLAVVGSAALGLHF